MATKPHWTQTPEGKLKMSEAQKKVWASKKDKSEHFRKLAKMGAKYKRGPYKTKAKDKKPTSLVVNGWRITLDKNEIRIEHE